MGIISPLLAARDMKETIEYYQKSLGFKVGMAYPNINNAEYVDLTKDGVVLMFIPATNMGVSGEEKLGIGVNHYIEIDGDIDDYYDELKKKGVNITVDIKDEPYGVRDFTVVDINGYQLSFARPSKNARTCVSCGMPMSKPEDFGGENPANLSCVHCSHPDGGLKSYDEVFQGMVSFMTNSQNLDRETAEIKTREYMAQMPAWSSDSL